MSETIFCGSGKEKFDGNLISIYVDLTEIPKEWIKKNDKGKSYVRLNVWRKKDGIDKYGNSHSVQVDTFVATNAENKPSKNDDLPF